MTNLPHGVRCTYYIYLQRVTTYCGVSQKEKTTYRGQAAVDRSGTLTRFRFDLPAIQN